MTRAGSSPRVRGKVVVVRHWFSFRGIIPAGAGKSDGGIFVGHFEGDHPRGCGEKNDRRPPLAEREGSSPRVRGKGALGRRTGRHPGIIPAGAGKSKTVPANPLNTEDHPRGCGEKSSSATPRSLPRGSSPRVRGKAEDCTTCFKGTGIIPAGAGKRNPENCEHSSSGDHPRGCGEKRMVGSSSRSSEGSSPRVRGKVPSPSPPSPSGSIIPAGAGKSAGERQAEALFRDHPRGCGEKQDARFRPFQRLGSSPRVRGKGLRDMAPDDPRRIIPAGAGKRAVPRPRDPCQEDHPRGCGEKNVTHWDIYDLEGSSPRVRGKVDVKALRRAAEEDHPHGCGEKTCT